MSVGVKSAFSAWLPAPSTVPLAGVYTKPPATSAVALSCVALSAVGYVIAAGVAHVITGVAFSTLIVTSFDAPL